MDMNGVRFTGSDRLVFDAKDIQILSSEVCAEIFADQYDGYTCLNKALCDAIAGSLAVFTVIAQWRIYADFDETKQRYRVWVKR